MINPDFRALCAELIQQLQELHTMVWGEAPHLLDEDRGGSAYLDLDIEDVLEKARAALAQPEPVAPTDEEIMELMPQQMRDDLANAARALAGFDRANVKAAGACRIILNRHAVDHARAALAKWGHQ